jgi:hypothetical protein
MYSSTLSLTSALDGGGLLTPRPDRFDKKSEERERDMAENKTCAREFASWFTHFRNSNTRHRTKVGVNLKGVQHFEHVKNVPYLTEHKRRHYSAGHFETWPAPRHMLIFSVPLFSQSLQVTELPSPSLTVHYLRPSDAVQIKFLQKCRQ